MTPEQYKELRQQIGTQEVVSNLLGVHKITIAKREAGLPRYPITLEAWYAIQWLAKWNKRK